MHADLTNVYLHTSVDRKWKSQICRVEIPPWGFLSLCLQKQSPTPFCPPTISSLLPASFHLTATPLFSLLVNCIPFPFSRTQEGGGWGGRDVRCLYADILTLEESTKSVWKHEHYTRMRFLNISFLNNGHQYSAITASNSPGKISDIILEGVFFDSATRALLRWSTGLAHSPVIV